MRRTEMYEMEILQGMQHGSEKTPDADKAPLDEKMHARGVIQVHFLVTQWRPIAMRVFGRQHVGWLKIIMGIDVQNRGRLWAMAISRHPVRERHNRPAVLERR